MRTLAQAPAATDCYKHSQSEASGWKPSLRHFDSQLSGCVEPHRTSTDIFIPVFPSYDNNNKNNNNNML